MMKNVKHCPICNRVIYYETENAAVYYPHGKKLCLLAQYADAKGWSSYGPVVERQTHCA